MRFLTAMDLVGLEPQALDEWSHQLFCPWCGEDAWAVSDYFQCYSDACPIQAASAEDLLAKYAGGHVQAAHFAAAKANVEPDERAALQRMADRKVTDMWIKFCQEPPTTESVKILNRLQSSGLGVRQSRFNMNVLSRVQMSELLDLADETGATYPDNWRKERPGVSQVFCVQTKPYTIDRILVVNGRGKAKEIVWHEYAAGFCSLLGLLPNSPRLLAADLEVMLRLQHDLAGMGRIEEVSAVYLDLFRGEACPRWDVMEHLFTAVPRHCHPSTKPEFFNANDIVRIQQVLDQLPGVERSIKGLPIDSIMRMIPRDKAVGWDRLRFGMIANMIPSGVVQVPPTCASIFEQTGTKVEDANALVDYFKRRGRVQLAEDFELLSRNRVIKRDARMVVKETANDYRIIQNSDTILLTNFSLQIHSGVTFRNVSTERYCQALLRCGTTTLEVMFPQNLLHDRVQSLEDEIQRHLTVAGETGEGRRVPTVIEVNKFRKYVVPHLRNQAAQSKSVQGIDRLGWSEDRKSFTLPGLVVTLDGLHQVGKILCPAVPLLQKYKAVDADQWAKVCPGELDQSCHDMVSMLIASCVRYFRRCAAKPIKIAQSSAAMTVLDRLMQAFGQTEIYPLNSNTRGTSDRIDGIHGYPLLVAGQRNTSNSQIPFLHLTDQGYKLPTSPYAEQAEAGGRAAQYCLLRVVEWCIATGGDEFVEVPALEHHRSLLREGQWLIRKVCELEDWEVSHGENTAIEELLRQIPYEEAGRRITLVDGQDLIIDVRGLPHDHDGILREARDMGMIAAFEDDKLLSSAVKLLPAISTFYGQTPDVAVV